MDTREHLGGEWLKANINVFDGDHIKFVDEGVTEEKDDRKRLVMTVLILKDGEPQKTKKFSLNKDNLKAIQALFGFESKKWKNKEMRVNVVKVSNHGRPTQQQKSNG
jgi:hypothetical protein